MRTWKAAVCGMIIMVRTNLDLHPGEDFGLVFLVKPDVGDYVISKKVWNGISQLKLIVCGIVHEDGECFIELTNWQPDFESFYRGLTR